MSRLNNVYFIKQFEFKSSFLSLLTNFKFFYLVKMYEGLNFVHLNLWKNNFNCVLTKSENLMNAFSIRGAAVKRTPHSTYKRQKSEKSILSVVVDAKRDTFTRITSDYIFGEINLEDYLFYMSKARISIDKKILSEVEELKASLNDNDKPNEVLNTFLIMKDVASIWFRNL